MEQGGIKELEGMVLTLSGNVIALRSELVVEQRKLMSYFKVLAKQMCEMQNSLDYISSYLDIAIENDIDLNDEEWIQV